MQVPSDELPNEGAALLPWGILLQGWAFTVFTTVASLSLLIEFSVSRRASVLPLWPRWGKEPSQWGEPEYRGGRICYQRGGFWAAPP